MPAAFSSLSCARSVAMIVDLSMPRSYLIFSRNVYVPALQCESGVVSFFRHHRGYQFASSALMDPMTKDFVAATERFSKFPLFFYGVWKCPVSVRKITTRTWA